MSAAKRVSNVEEVLELLPLDDLDWNESEARDVEEKIDYQAVWEPFNPLDYAEVQADFADKFGSSTEPPEEHETEEDYQVEVIL